MLTFNLNLTDILSTILLVYCSIVKKIEYLSIIYLITMNLTDYADIVKKIKRYYPITLKHNIKWKIGNFTCCIKDFSLLKPALYCIQIPDGTPGGYIIICNKTKEILACDMSSENIYRLLDELADL